MCKCEGAGSSLPATPDVDVLKKKKKVTNIYVYQRETVPCTCFNNPAGKTWPFRKVATKIKKNLVKKKVAQILKASHFT